MADFDDLLSDLENLSAQVEQDVEDALRYAAIRTVNEARERGNYTDRTGNLRASIGYGIAQDGKVEEDHIPRVSGSKGPSTLKEKATASGEGKSVIIVAGMPYATYVEAKGYDVITGSILKFDEFFREYND